MTSLISQEHNIPDNATIRQEYVKCGNPDCEELHKPHGPYLYAYWKENKKLKKKYIGRRLEDYYHRKNCKELDITLSQTKKHEYLKEESQKGNDFARQYFQKYKDNKVSVDWAYRKVRDKIANDVVKPIYERIARRMELVDKASGEAVNGETRLMAAAITCNLMLNAGLDVTSDQDIDRFLTSKELPKL